MPSRTNANASFADSLEMCPKYVILQALPIAVVCRRYHHNTLIVRCNVFVAIDMFALETPCGGRLLSIDCGFRIDGKDGPEDGLRWVFGEIVGISG
jgi:hypothetical protein